ncbi:UNVERIFIED_CONTAM: ATP-binding protein [Kocuria sp. CPCC 205316]|uniref:sensor histidine kinase n=1 Tax=Kocuria TaxID=57493 RepID=UPI0036D857DC
MSHAAPGPPLAYRKVPARRRRSNLLVPTSPQELGMNSYRIHLLANICHGLVVVALSLEALTIVGDQLRAFERWHLVFLLALLANGGAMLLQGVRRQVRMWPVLAAPVLVALAVLTLPLAWTGAPPPQDPWVEPFILLAAAATVVAWSIELAVAYLASVTVFYVLVMVRTTESADVMGVLFDATSRIAFGVVLVVLISLVYKGGQNADQVYAAAIAQELQLNRSRSQAEEQERLDRLIHDNVMAALLDAGRAPGPVQRRTRELAQRALEVLAFEERRAEGKGTTMVHTLLDDLLESLSPWRNRVRFNSITPYIRPPGQPRPLIPVETAQALVQAVTEAVSNSARHAGTEVTFVTMDGGVCPPTPLNPEGFFLRFQVVDRGRGFQVRSIDSRRLGVRVSILGNVRHVGGAVDVDSAPGRGTRVTILWPRDAQP